MPVSRTTCRPRSARPTVLVTGGSGGIGRAICLAFGRAGWKVGVHYRTREREAKRTAALVQKHGGSVMLLHADIRDSKQVQEMVNQFIDRWGRLDVMICNAGQSTSDLVLRMEPQDWASVVETNLTGTFHCLQAAGRVMLPKRDGTVLIVGSAAGVQGQAGQAAYATSKAGLLGLVKTAAKEWGGHNIRVSALFPGWQKTELAGPAFPAQASVDHVLGRTPSLEEVANSVVHLALLRDSSGQIWNCDSRIF